MLCSKHIDRVCCLALAVMLILTCTLMGSAHSDPVGQTMGYESRLFNQDRVHSLDIVIDDWDAFLETCTAEEYSPCTLVIDGESFGTVGIRGKGNTSLSNVASYGNSRYSYKVEFDQYQAGKSYHGLDKLSLNNLIQDKTLLKDYLAYTLMNKMGVAAPLCSFVQIYVNGEYWGLYLAVEGVEDAFLARNYGSNPGELYKPDSMSFGGGRGNGRDFDMSEIQEQFSQMFGEAEPSEIRERFSQMAQPGQMPGMGGFIPENMPDMSGFSRDSSEESADRSFERGGMGSSDVKLQYIDDDPSSYANIFNNAKTDTTPTDQQRLIEALKALSEGDTSAVDVDSVIRYFVVHNFMCNDDSYTGQMIHNYYLHESDGVLSMIPWDYNLSFGGFSRGAASDATDVVNTPIDSIVSQGDGSDRPMAAWILGSEVYMQQYRDTYAEFVDTVWSSGWLEAELVRIQAMLAPCVETDPTAFFSYEEFLTACESLNEFVALRFESVSGQISGSIPASSDAQRSSSSALVDASHIDLADLGELGMGGGKGGFDRNTAPSHSTETMPESDEETIPDETSQGNQTPWTSGETPQGMSGQAAESTVAVEEVSVEEGSGAASSPPPITPAGSASPDSEGIPFKQFDLPFDDSQPIQSTPAEQSSFSGSLPLLLACFAGLVAALLAAGLFKSSL